MRNWFALSSTIFVASRMVLASTKKAIDTVENVRHGRRSWAQNSTRTGANSQPGSGCGAGSHRASSIGEIAERQKLARDDHRQDKTLRNRWN
jgi:hypothetical protein